LSKGFYHVFIYHKVDTIISSRYLQHIGILKVIEQGNCFRYN